jgi:hypothetical protein
MSILPELKNRRSVLNQIFRDSSNWFTKFGRHAVLVNQSDNGEISTAPITIEMLVEDGYEELLKKVERYDPTCAVVVLGMPSNMFMTLAVIPEDELKEKALALESGWLRRIMTQRKSSNS